MLRSRVALFAVLVVCLAAPITAFSAPAASAEDTTGPPRVSIGSGSVVEGQMTRRFIRFTMSLSWQSASTITVTFSTADLAPGPGSATAGPDYRAKVQTFTFLPGQIAKYVAVLVWPDMQDEPDETFAVQLSNLTNATPGIMSGLGTILDDDPNVGPRVSIGDSAVPETCANRPVHASAVVTLSVPLASQLVVQVSTTPVTGGATPGVDYTSISKQFTFFASQNLKEFKVPIRFDQVLEGDEQLKVNLSVVSGPALVGRAEGTVTILDCVAPA